MNPNLSDETRSAQARVIPRVALMLLLGPLRPGTVAAGPLFDAAFYSFEAGVYPKSVAIGDLDADGKPDLVVASYGAGPPGVGSVSVLLGHGDGTFGAKTEFGTGDTPSCVAMGDLNMDGKPDLAVSNANSNTVSVLLANGDGTFAVHTDFGTGNCPSYVAIGDLNGDSKPDLAVSNANSSTVSVLLGNGDGTFGVHTDFATGSRPSCVAIGDLSGDGDPDLAVANASSNTLSVLLGHGDGSFGAKVDYGTGRDPISLAIDDLDGDGHPDLAVANPGHYPVHDNAVSVLLGHGDGSFGARTDFATGGQPQSIAISDLNGDGKLDLATANAGSTVSALLGHGDGSFGANADFPTGAQPQSVAIGDLNGDGNPDLATANTGSTVSALLGNGDGSFGPKIHFATGSSPASVAIGDLNGDGKPDLVAANNGDNTISVLLGNGHGSFGAKTDYEAGFGIFSAAIGDLNADGKPDLVAAIHGGWPGFGGLAVLLGNGDGTFGTATGYGTVGNATFVAIGDLNGDGSQDLAVATVQGSFSDAGAVLVLLGNGDGSFGAQTTFATGNPCVSVAIGDLNADGKADLATANNAGCQDVEACPGSVAVLLGNGDGTFGANMYYQPGYYPGYSPTCVAIGDVNTDGKPDLVTGTGAGLRGRGDGTFGTEIHYRAGGTSIAIGDLNGDGMPDLAAANRSSNAASVVLGNGDGTFSARADFGVGKEPDSVAIGDLNGDGKFDLVTANLRSNTMSTLLNIGPSSCPMVPMTFDLTPHTLPLHSRGQWVTGLLEPGLPASPADIDITSIRLNGSVPVDASAPTSIGDADNDGRPDLTVKFNRAAVGLAVEEGDQVRVTVSGEIGNGCFEATAVIRVMPSHAPPTRMSQSGPLLRTPW